jgi:3-deoxy-D-manno-octulosonic-acid transferase
MLSNLDALLMRSEFDAARMKQLCEKVGARQAASKVLAPGDVKLDSLEPAEQNAYLRAEWRALLKIGDDETLWLCGSTHPHSDGAQASEEEMLLRVYQKLKGQSGLRLLLAPRHIERTKEVLTLCDKLEVKAVPRSKIARSVGHEVLVLDSVGELAEIYAAADVAFVGGSLVPRGGHNLLEPVQRGVPVLFGPHIANFRAAAALVQNEKLGEAVSDEKSLGERLEYWLSHPEERSQIAVRARRALAPHQGAARHIAQEVAERLKSKANKSQRANL